MSRITSAAGSFSSLVLLSGLVELAFLTLMVCHIGLGRVVPLAVMLGMATLPWTVGLLGTEVIVGRAVAALAGLETPDARNVLALGVGQAMASRMLGAWMSAALLLGLGLGLAMAGAGASSELPFRSSPQGAPRQPRARNRRGHHAGHPRAAGSAGGPPPLRAAHGGTPDAHLRAHPPLEPGRGRCAAPAALTPGVLRAAAQPGRGAPRVAAAPLLAHGPRVDGQRLPGGRCHRPALPGCPPLAPRRAGCAHRGPGRAFPAPRLRAAPHLRGLHAAPVRGARHCGGTDARGGRAPRLEQPGQGAGGVALGLAALHPPQSTRPSGVVPEPVLPVLADARTPGSSLRRLIEASALAGARSVELVGQHPHSANLPTLEKLDAQEPLLSLLAAQEGTLQLLLPAALSQPVSLSWRARFGEGERLLLSPTQGGETLSLSLRARWPRCRRCSPERSWAGAAGEHLLEGARRRGRGARAGGSVAGVGARSGSRLTLPMNGGTSTLWLPSLARPARRPRASGARQSSGGGDWRRSTRRTRRMPCRERLPARPSPSRPFRTARTAARRRPGVPRPP